jgi:putative ATP-dependent endonuclease of OLD family
MESKVKETNVANNLYISRVFIKNFRNFQYVDIETSQKQIIFGENESGKTNYLFALQLILDPSLSDDDRCLSSTDFNIKILDPIENREEIVISLFISNFENSKTILAQMNDAVVSIDGIKFLKITYKYYPNELEDTTAEYKYIIFKGNDETKFFTYSDRKYLQLKVIKPLRDVEYELKNARLSPLLRLLQEYEINQERVKKISETMFDQSRALLDIDEIRDLKKIIEANLIDILGNKSAPTVEFSMTDIESSKLIFALRILLSGRLLEEKSLGIKNVLYIILLLLQFKKSVVPSLISDREFVRYFDADANKLLEQNYSKISENNYRLINDPDMQSLEKFFLENQKIGIPEVIIAIEEPEAHLHPIFQRLVFRNIILSSDYSVLLTTHSPNIVSVSPLDYIVHILRETDSISNINSCVNLDISRKERIDIERYFDVNRGEIYFGRGVLLVEGIAEEYLVRRFAKLLDMPLDIYGIVVGNINSTNFLPYIQFLKKIGIPYAAITDGDFYYLNNDGSKEYHCLKTETDKRTVGYLGIENVKRILASIGVIVQKDISDEQFRRIAEENGCFIGEYTFEVDIMKSSISKTESLEKIINAYKSIEIDSTTKQEKFSKELSTGDFFVCLKRIETNGLGKGRFAQRFSNECIKENIPSYVQKSIEYISKVVSNT